MTIVEGLEPQEAQAAEQQLPVEVTPVDDFGPWAGWEFDFAKKSPLAYPLVRTVADIIPFASKLFPSGQREFAEMSLLGKTVDIGLDVAVLIPARYIGMGFKAAIRPALRPIKAGAKAGAKRLPFRIQKIGDQSKAYLDALANKMDKFIYRTPKERAVAKYGLADDEAEALVAREANVIYRGRSGFSSVEDRPVLRKLFTKEGKLMERVEKKLVQWEIPRRSQRLKHHVKEYEKIMKPLLTKKAEIPEVFNRQVERLFGKEKIGKLTIENISDRDMSKVLMDLLLNEGKVLRGLDVTGRQYLMPIRKVLGMFEDRFKTFEGIYKPVVRYIGEMNTSSVLATEQWQKLLWQKNLLKAKKGGKWTELYGKEDVRAAGKALAQVDNMQGAGAKQEEINALLGKLDVKAQNLVKTFQVWADYMYGEFMKVKIPQLFRKAGLTERGSSAIRAEMEREGKGLSQSISAIFSDSANLAYNNRFNYVEGVLGDLQKLVEKSPKWFVEPGGDNVKALLKELTFRKPMAKRGFPSYLQNYSPRLFAEKKGLQEAKISALTPEQMTAGFVKTRTAETAEGRVEDLFEMIGSRARSQAKELYMFPHLSELRAVMKTLPPRLKTYVGHYMSRILGLPSKVDGQVARALNRTLGTVWSGRRINNLAWRINDLIYMGGIGFKPFSAMRNLLQVPLNVPADLGGIKDVSWLVRGAKRATNPESFRYLSKIGAITEYSPDILFKPILTKLGPKVGKLQLPTMQGVRDVAMWMFKKSDQWNRLWTGSAAMEKWEYHFAKNMIGKQQNLKAFKKSLNLNSRESWVRADIENTLDLGSATAYEEAKKLWIKDVVADTQYLYGATDSPLIGQVGGAVTRTAVVFQSWWMNYASLLGKWMTRSGGVEPAAQRLFVWMLASSAIITQLDDVWGKQRAFSTAFLGPLPSQLDAPASWRPFIEAFNTMRLAAEITMGKEPEAAKKQMIATLKTAMIYAPGGLQLKQLYAGAKKEGWSGVFKASLGYRPPEK